MRQNAEGDLHIDEYIERIEQGTMDQFIPEHARPLVEAGAPWVFFVKWTCPKCGDRCTSNVPNMLQTEGYEHTFREDGEWCGHVYREPYLGLTVIVGIDAEQAELLTANDEESLL